MEVKINREIRDYTESIFFGLSIRQFVYTCLSCISAIIVFFLFRNILGLEIVSWLCMLSASPFIFLGFFTYNQMNANDFLISIIKSEFLTKKYLNFKSKNMYVEILNEIENEKKKRKRNDKNTKRNKEE